MTMDVQPTASHFVDGAPMEDTAGAEMPLIYPATGERLGGSTPPRRGHRGGADPPPRRRRRDWAALTGAERGRVLTRAAAILRERNRELSELETLDTGKPLSETLVADAASGADCLEYFGGMAATLTGETVELGGDFAYTIREPLGVCAAIGAWNYPSRSPAGRPRRRLACGNAMVFKPSEETPLSALKLAEILVEAGAPPGVFNVIQGAARSARRWSAMRAWPRSRSPDRCPRAARSMPPRPRG
jgi:betaine-aldehyde dehydrogenase